MKAGTLVLTLALLAPLALQAQSPAARAESPAKRLLAHRAELALTAEQVKKIEAVDRQLAARDQETVKQLEALRGKPLGEPLRMRDMTAADRAAALEKRGDVQPLMQQLRTSHQQAITDVKAVLTPDQAARADAYLYQGPGQGRGNGPMAAGRGNGAGRAQMSGRGNGAGRAQMSGRGGNAGRGRGMMMHRPGADTTRGRFGRGR